MFVWLIKSTPYKYNYHCADTGISGDHLDFASCCSSRVLAVLTLGSVERDLIVLYMDYYEQSKL